MISETRTCQNCKNEFTIEPEDFDFYERIKVPAPTFCWLCRAERRFAWRNERFLSKRKSDFTGKEIFSMYPGETISPVYEIDNWQGDGWDREKNVQEISFERPFLEQFRDLLFKTPVYDRSVLFDHNSPYSSNFSGFKNCYLCFNGSYVEESMYSTGIDFSKNCIDVNQADHLEDSCDSFAAWSGTRLFGCNSCGESFNLFFCKSCVGCSDCIGCVNLKNKKYHIFNQPYSKEEYETKLKEFKLGTWTGYRKLRKEARRFWLQNPHKFMEGFKNVNCSGAYVGNSKNVNYGYFVFGGENMKYCQIVPNGKNADCYDFAIWGENSDLIYESMVCGSGCHNLKFCHEAWPEMRDSEYAFFCQNSSNLFACAGLKNKSYCILNKQYSKEEYEELVPKIKKFMDERPYVDKNGLAYKYGEFLPMEWSLVPYNLTLAQDFFPKSSDEVRAKGYVWKELEEKDYQITKSFKDLPDDILDAAEDVTKELILCEAWSENPEEAKKHNCTKAFRILPQEFAFYKHFNVPLPRKCPASRRAERILDRNHFNLYDRNCDCGGEASLDQSYTNQLKHSHGASACKNVFKTSFGKDRPEIVYCEDCYNLEVA